MRKTFLLILVFLFFAVQAQSADQVDFPDIYIDADAGDGGVGSQADPHNNLTDIDWETGVDNSIFDYYAGSETASVTINLQKGDRWREKLRVYASGSASYPIIIQSYGTGADPIIDGADDITTAGWTDQGSNIWRYNIGEDDPGLVWFDGSLGTIDATPDSFGEWTYSDPNLDIYAESDPDNEVYYSSVEARVRAAGLLMEDYDNITVIGIEATRSFGPCFYVRETAGVTLENYIFRDITASYCSAGMWIRALPGQEVQNVIVEDSHLHHNGAGLYMTRLNDSIVRRNLTEYNGRTYHSTAEEYGLTLNGSDNEYYENTSRYNEGNGIHVYGNLPDGGLLDNPTNRNKIYKNLFEDNGQDSDYTGGAEVRIVGTEYVKDNEMDENEFYLNTVKSNLNGIYLRAPDTKIYNNIFISLTGTDSGIKVRSNEFDIETVIANNTLYNYNIGIELESEYTDYSALTIKNNILAGGTIGTSEVVDADFDYNLYYDNTTNQVWRLVDEESNNETDFWINPVSGNSFFRSLYRDMSFSAGRSIKMTLTDDSAETLEGYIGGADVSKTLGTEEITTQNNRDFSSDNMGSWQLVDDCTDSTLAFDNTDIGGADDKQAKLTVDETTDDCTHGYARISTGTMSPKSTRRMYTLSVNLYVPAASTNNDVTVYWRKLDGSRPAEGVTVTLADDTWTTVTLDTYWHDDVDGYVRIGFSTDTGPEDGDIFYFDDVSIKPILTAGTDAVRIYTAGDLVTQGWVDSGTNFDFTDAEYDVTFSPSLSSNDVVGDPLFTDSGNYVFTLLSGSPAKNAGVDLGDSYDDGLNPTSTWPDGVLTIDQDDYGNWDIGAYVWPGILRPMGFRIIGWSVF